ncbi:MAG: cell division protein FtsZ [Rhizobiaceae bacterium]|nr:cell division protein FtsZ [Rhizobiaceae bacterium]
MTINLKKPDITELKPKITVFGVGGGGGNAVNNMINGGLEEVDFVVANTDAQALSMSSSEKVIQLGVDVTEGLGAGSQPEVGRAAAEECIDEIRDYLDGTHMAFVTAGMGGGTGTGAAPVVARAAREMGVLTVGVVTKPFHFEGARRMKTAEAGIQELQENVDTLIVIPNQNLFRIANEKTGFADAFGMADQVLYSGVACITDLMVKEGLINLDFADVRSVMREMGKAMMGTGEASGEGRALAAAEAAISNPLLDGTSMRGAQGLLISITGGRDLTLFEVDEAATRIREEIDEEANIILGATFDESLEGVIRVSVVATGIDKGVTTSAISPATQSMDAIGMRQKIQTPIGQSSLASATPAVSAKPVSPVNPLSIKTPMAAAPVATPASSPVEALSKAVEKEGVKLEPFKPATGIFNDPIIDEEFGAALESELMPLANEFVPTIAENPGKVFQTPKIPEVKDFPPIAQAEMNAESAMKKDADPVAHADDRGPMGLLRKLKQGFGVSEQVKPAPEMKPEVAPMARDVAAAPQPSALMASRTAPLDETKPAAPMAPAASQSRIDDNPYAPRTGQLDANGRTIPAERAVSEDDQLDIPAFLRRQAN